MVLVALGRHDRHTAMPALLPLLIHGNLRYRKIDEEGKNKRYRETREEIARAATSWEISWDALV